MRRLTVSTRACTETLALLIAMAWADGTLDDAEKAGIERAARDLNLPHEARARLATALENPTKLDDLELDETLPEKERAFAYVAASWMAGIDAVRDEKEEALLERIGLTLELPRDRRAKLDEAVKTLPKREEAPPGAPPGVEVAAGEIVALFKAIPSLLEETSIDADPDEDVEVVFD